MKLLFLIFCDGATCRSEELSALLRATQLVSHIARLIFVELFEDRVYSYLP